MALPDRRQPEGPRPARPVPAAAAPPAATWHPLVELALAEDVGSGDVTSRVSLAPDARGAARIEAREACVVCGLAVAREVFRRVDPDVRFEARCADGEAVASGERLVQLAGPLASILTAERTALNFLTRLGGIATLTRRFVRELEGTSTRVVDTRKTLPGWRALDKYAVAVGGGVNHRSGLFDGILLKDNHLAAAGGVDAAVKAARAAAPAHLRVQVEVESEEDAVAAVEAGADFLLLDNLPPSACAAVVRRLGPGVLLEASGGLHLDDVRAYAEAGVQRVSVGALTHSPPAVDLALEVEPGGVPG